MTEPLKDRIWRDLLKKILSGEYRIGQKMPTGKKLEQIYGVSSAPITNALRRLAADGLIERHPGRGTFVKSTTANPVHTKLSPFSYYYSNYLDRISVETIGVDRQFAPEDVAKELGVTSRRQVSFIKRLRYMDSRPVILMFCWIRPGIPIQPFSQDRHFFRTVDFLKESLNIYCFQAREVVEATIPTLSERELLQLAEGVPVLRVNRVLYDWDGVPAVYNRYLVNTEKWKYRISLSF